MFLQLTLLITSYLITVNGATNNKFPLNFKFGSATAAYQIEGGWNADGKGENIWDHAVHSNPSPINNNDTGDIACDSYHKYKEDVKLLKDLGVSFYRFSIAWSRILPSGFTNHINQVGVNYYLNLLKELRTAGIEPMVSLYHWDLPQPLQDIGGWTNPLLADHFADYARLCFKLFGDYVKTWITINEPYAVCHYGYGIALMAPFISSDGVGSYLCGHTVLLSHARAYHIYDKEFRPIQHGRIAVIVDSDWSEPASSDPEDIEAAETKLQFKIGWFANPIFNGNYPQVMIDRIAARSKAEGFLKSRLPTFSQQEIDFIKGTSDFLPFNTYTTTLVKKIPEPPYDGHPSWMKDMSIEYYQNDTWPGSASSWLKIVPWGVRKLINWIDNKYGHPEIILTESGISDKGTDLDDDERIFYYKEYMSNVLLAKLNDGINVTGYTFWSLLDNFEWNRGYSEKFGLYHVDFESGSRSRTAKKSVKYLKKVISTRCLTDSCE